MIVHDIYSGDVNVTMSKGTYGNGNLAIQLWCEDGPYATLTKNFDTLSDPHLAYLDTNNCPWVEQFVKENDLGYPLAMERRSGGCVYPLYYIE